MDTFKYEDSPGLWRGEKLTVEDESSHVDIAVSDYDGWARMSLKRDDARKLRDWLNDWLEQDPSNEG
jgi:hypothetical protein